MGGWFARKPVQPPALTGLPDLQYAHGTFEMGNYAPLEKLLSHPRADHRYFYASEVAALVARQQVEAWAAECPGHAPALLLKAVHGPIWAWQARSAKQACAVTEEQWRGFEERLDSAQQDLEEMIRAFPQDVNFLAVQLQLAKGLDWPLEEKRALFERARQLDPNHYAMHRIHLDGILEKWGGTHRETTEFALGLVRGGSPAGSELGCLLHVAYTEKWLFHHAFENDPQLARDMCNALPVIAATREAYEHSLGSPEHQEWPGSVEARNETAFWLYMCGQKSLLKREIQAIGPRLLARPWKYLGDPATVYAEARKLAGA